MEIGQIIEYNKEKYEVIKIEQDYDIYNRPYEIITLKNVSSGKQIKVFGATPIKGYK